MVSIMKYFPFLPLIALCSCSWLQNHPEVQADLKTLEGDAVKAVEDAVFVPPVAPAKK